MAAAAATPTSEKKTMRRSLMTLWSQSGYWDELDRIMIALHRFQTEGRVDYRMMIGMHGGGGGNKRKGFAELMEAKVAADIKTHYDGKFPDKFHWPEPVPNAAPPTLIDKADRCFTYTFCWHAEPQFIVWHRALTAEFERMLQDYDPKREGDSIHSGPDALGLPYWGWEHWDGETLPIQVTSPTYTVRTNAWSNKGYKAGDVFTNPFHRWFAPVSVEQQRAEYFPDVLADNNCTTRAISFTNPAVENELPWPIGRLPNQNPDNNPTMEEVVQTALAEPNYLKFATTKFGFQKSIENPHNKFHNHVGGYTLGGPQGPGKQVVNTTDPDIPKEFTGTMAQNQSIFDPIFWLHHSNVERQLCSWQRLHKDSRPPKDVLDTVLYPFTTPKELAKGQFSWNTKVGGGRDGTLKDWFDAELTYEYDDYLEAQAAPDPTTPLTLALDSATNLMSFTGAAAPTRRMHFVAVPRQTVKLTAQMADPRGGEFVVERSGEEIAHLSVLSGWGSGCARCARRAHEISFDVTHAFGPSEKLNKKQLVLKRNGETVKVEEWELKAESTEQPAAPASPSVGDKRKGSRASGGDDGPGRKSARH